MTEAQLIGWFASLVGLIGGVLAVWWRIEGRIREAEKVADERLEDVEKKINERSAAISAHAALISSHLAEHKLHVAETYVSKAGMREMRDEIMTGMRDLKGSVSTIHERIDQMILAERPANKRQTTSSR